MPNNKCPICKRGQLYSDDVLMRCNSCDFKYRRNTESRIDDWAKGKSWLFPTVILIIFSYTALRYFLDFEYPIARYENPISFVDLGIHEVGHLLFASTGEFMSILGGSLFQILVPIIAVVGLYKDKYFFGSATAFIWLGLSLLDVATYVADATARNLPLVTIGGGDYENAHDWHQLLSRTGHLDLDNEIATLLRIIGAISIALGMYLSIYIIVKIYSTRKN